MNKKGTFFFFFIVFANSSLLSVTKTIHEAVLSDDIVAAKQLLKVNPNLVHSKKQSQGDTPLHFVKSAEMTNLLFDYGAQSDIEARNANNRTPLHKAARRGNADVVEILIKKGANINAIALEDYTPLHFAVVSDDLDTLRILTNANSDNLYAFNIHGYTPLHNAVKLRSTTSVKYFIDEAKMNIMTKTKDGKTPLDISKKFLPQIVYTTQKKKALEIKTYIEKKMGISPSPNSPSTNNPQNSVSFFSIETHKQHKEKWLVLFVTLIGIYVLERKGFFRCVAKKFTLHKISKDKEKNLMKKLRDLSHQHTDGKIDYYTYLHQRETILKKTNTSLQ